MGQAECGADLATTTWLAAHYCAERRPASNLDESDGGFHRLDFTNAGYNDAFLGSVSVVLHVVRDGFRIFDGTLGFPGEGWRGQRGARALDSKLLFGFHNVLTMAGRVETKGRSVCMRGDATKEQMVIDCAAHQDLYLMGFAEHRWTSAGERPAANSWHCLHTSAGVSTGDGYHGGVGVYLSRHATRAWRELSSQVEHVDDRLMSIRIPIGAPSERKFTFRQLPGGDELAVSTIG